MNVKVQRENALVGANVARAQRKEIRAALADGTLSLIDVILAPPHVLREVPMWELLSWGRGIGNRRIVAINRWAMDDRINLAVPLGLTNERHRRWVIRHITTTIYRN